MKYLVVFVFYDHHIVLSFAKKKYLGGHNINMFMFHIKVKDMYIRLNATTPTLFLILVETMFFFFFLEANVMCTQY